MFDRKCFLSCFMMITCISFMHTIIAVPKFFNVDAYKSPEPNVRFPGSDTANFPSSPFTLPKGQGYFENFPIAIDTEGNNTPFLYSWPFLLRFGVTDFLEFRLFSQGITYTSDSKRRQRTAGFAPLAADFKAHLWGTEDLFWAPSGGIEIYIITPFASPKLEIGTQLVISALFNHRFPDNISFEWNAGMGVTRFSKFSNSDDFYWLVSWALSKELTHTLDLFFQGLYNTEVCNISPKLFFLGIGLISIIHPRLSIYGTFNWSIYDNTNPYWINIGFTVAF